MKIIGHRGAAGLAPENTLASFRAAIKHGVDAMELDVRVTKDHHVVIHHDPEIGDPSRNFLRISKHNYRELLLHHSKLLTLDELFEALKKHPVELLIEIKPNEPTKPIIAAIKRHLKAGWPADKLSIGSFDQQIMRECKKALPDIGLVVIESWSGVRARNRAKELGTKRLNMRSWWLWAVFLAAMQHRGYEISPYTMNDPRRVRIWEPFLYGVITDHPERMQEFRDSD